MKELTREELPDDGTHFVVTWCYSDKRWSETGRLREGEVQLYSTEWDGGLEEDCTNVRYWQFPEGENDVTYPTNEEHAQRCLLYTSPSPRDQRGSRMPSSA